MARWRVISKNCFDTLVLKIVGGEVASISKQTFFDEYEFKIPLWRGGEPLLTLALKINLKNHWWRGGEHIQTVSL